MIRTAIARVLERVLIAVRPPAMPAQTSNVDYNKRLWDLYARAWDEGNVEIEDQTVGKDQVESYLKFVGDEWGRVSDVEEIVRDYIDPYISAQSAVAELGSGGGRIAAKVAGKVGKLYCLDISAEMLRRAKAALSAHHNVE